MNQRRSRRLNIVIKASWVLLAMNLPIVGNSQAMESAVHTGMPKLPLSFVANAGQFDKSVEFSASQGRYSLLLGATETAMVSSPVGKSGTTTVVRMRFVGAGSAVEVQGRDRLQGIVHYYYGNDPEHWIRDVPTYGVAARVGLYPGITQVYRATDGRWKSEFQVAPGADPTQILMEYSEIESLEIDAGELVVRTATGEWRESAPLVYQEIASRHLEIEASYRLFGSGRVGFAIGPYDPSVELLIDPTLTFSTYLGGTAADVGGGIAIDSGGNVIVVGTTRSIDFPLENPVQAVKAGPVSSSVSANDMFVAKLDPTGSALIYSTYLGGDSREYGNDVAVDGAGNAHVVGWTTSSNFPTTTGVLGETPFGVNGGTLDDAAVFKLDPTGALVYSTYLGGSGDDQPEDIAVGADGHAYVTGNSSSANFPTTPGAYSTTNQGIWDVFVSKLEIDASALDYSTFIGGTAFDEPIALALDAVGNAYITGRTQSSDYPIFHPTDDVYDPTFNGIDTVFLTKLNAAGSDVFYSTYLDGISPRFGARKLDVGVDSNANAYVVAPSEGNGFPATDGAFDETFNGVVDVVVMKVKPDGSGPLLYSTFLGSSGDDRANGIAVDSSGSVWITGSTTSDDFPLVDALSTSLGGAQDAFLARLSPAGTSLLFASYLGGSDSDRANAVALGARGLCLTGNTASVDFPTTAPQSLSPFQPNFAGGVNDAFVACLGGDQNLVDIPTLSHLGLVALASMFLFAGAWLLRRRHTG